MQSSPRQGQKVVLRFKSIGSGLMPGGKGKIDSFAIAGVDRVWHWADAKIDKDSVILSSLKVKQPVAGALCLGDESIRS